MNHSDGSPGVPLPMGCASRLSSSAVTKVIASAASARKKPSLQAPCALSSGEMASVTASAVREFCSSGAPVEPAETRHSSAAARSSVSST